MEILDIPLIQEIGGLVLKDCYDLYNMLNSFITNTIRKFVYFAANLTINNYSKHI